MINPLTAIQAHLDEFRTLGARRLGVFGSFARGEARDDSDVDVYVEFDEAKRTTTIFSPCTNGWRICWGGAWTS